MFQPQARREVQSSDSFVQPHVASAGSPAGAGTPAASHVVSAGSSAAGSVVQASSQLHAIPRPAASRRDGDSGSVHRSVHPDTFAWGPFRLTFMDANKRPPHGCWQATCAFHRKSSATGCKRAVTLGSGDDSKDLCKRMLRQWCLQAPLHETKKSHASVPLSAEEVLPMAVLDSKLKSLPMPPATIRTDEEIEAAQQQALRAGIAAHPKAKGKAKAKAATTKPKSKTKAKAKGVAKSALPANDEAASDPESSSSSSSSSSGSSRGCQCDSLSTD